MGPLPGRLRTALEQCACLTSSPIGVVVAPGHHRTGPDEPTCRSGSGLHSLGVARRLNELYQAFAPVAQRIEHLTTDQKVGGSNLSGCANVMSRDIVAFLGPFGIPAGDGGAVLAGSRLGPAGGTPKAKCSNVSRRLNVRLVTVLARCRRPRSGDSGCRDGRVGAHDEALLGRFAPRQQQRELENRHPPHLDGMTTR